MWFVSTEFAAEALEEGAGAVFRELSVGLRRRMVGIWDNVVHHKVLDPSAYVADTAGL